MEVGGIEMKVMLEMTANGKVERMNVYTENDIYQLLDRVVQRRIDENVYDELEKRKLDFFE